jgi:hypothetical protein
LFVNTFGVVRVISIFCAIKKAHHLRAHKGLTITMHLEVLEMIKKSWEGERVIGHNQFILSPAAKQNIMRMDVSQKVMAAVLVYFAGTLADQQHKVPDILFSEIAFFLTAELYLLLESFLKDTLIPTNENSTVATCSLLLNAIILTGKYSRRAINVG